MNKHEIEIALEDIIKDLDRLMWATIDEIGDLDKEHDLQDILSIISDMYVRYERDMEV